MERGEFNRGAGKGFFPTFIVGIQKIFIYLWASPCFSVNLGQQKLDKVRELLRSSAFTSINDPPHKSHILNDLQLIYKRYIARLDVFILLISTNHMPVFSRDYPQNSLQSNTKRLIVLPPRKRGQIFEIDKLITCSLICLNCLFSLRLDFNLALRRARLWLTVL